MSNTVKKEEAEKYNWFQACNLLRIVGVSRKVVEIKYESALYSEKEWIEILKKDNLY